MKRLVYIWFLHETIGAILFFFKSVCSALAKSKKKKNTSVQIRNSSLRFEGLQGINEMAAAEHDSTSADS